MSTAAGTQRVEKLEPRDPRLAQIVEELRAFLVDLVERHQITTDEWIAAIMFLIELTGRNEVIALSDVLRLSVAVDRVTHGENDQLTPSNVEGPFWLDDAPMLDSPADLCDDQEPGLRVVIRGKVRTADGQGLPGAIVGIWQANAEGDYDLQMYEEGLEEMKLRARVRADADGAYEILTVKPRAYTVPTDGPLGELLAGIGRHPWRPAHYHFRIGRRVASRSSQCCTSRTIPGSSTT